jgi:DNA (cytosine-5)-methyltransferase 1
MSSQPPYQVLDLCSGIGGIALGLERTGGFHTAAFAEISPFCQQVLKAHWPTVPIFGDITHVNRATLEAAGVTGIDCITAGFPCQPFSQVGRHKGQDDERYIWPEIARLIRELRPHLILLENVPGLLTINHGREFGIVLGDLAELDYDAEGEVLSAAEFGAAHLRERLWLVAYTDSELLQGRAVFGSSEEGRARLKKQLSGFLSSGTRLALSECEPYREPNGIPRRLDRLHALGNAVYPPAVEWIGRRILAVRA